MIDPTQYNEQFRAACSRLGLSVSVLGTAFGYEILLAESLWFEGRPGLLITSGLHGEEPGGPLGILRFLMNVDGASLEGINLAILPLINPDGHARGTRYNRLNEVSNQAFAFDPGKGPSTESKVILAHADRLSARATACVLDLHEDWEGRGCYVYPPTDEPPSSLHKTLLALGASRFGVQPDGPVTADGVVQDGFAEMVGGGTDGSFSELFYRKGTPHVAVTETPGTYPLRERVAVNEALIIETLAWVNNMAHRVAARFRQAGADRVVYHGSVRTPVDKIPPVDGGSDFDIWGKGAYLAFSPDEAERYGTVRPLTLSGSAKLAPDRLWVEALKEAHAKRLRGPKDRAWAREKLRAEGWDGLQNQQYALVWNEGLLRLAHHERTADLSPPLGDPGGPCQVIRRIDKSIGNPRLKEDLIEDVERGGELSNPDAAKVYPLDTETGAGIAKELVLTSHLQYRMDLRSVKVDDVRATLRAMTQALKTNPGPAQDLAHGEKVRYEDPRTRLVIVVQVAGKDKLRLITTFWKGRPDPKPVQQETCKL